jgi:transcriptional regulator with XRE-family HTH domain
MTFGTWLRAERLARNWTQAELARLAGISPQAVAHYEADRRPTPRGQTLGGLARALGLTTDEVLIAVGGAGQTTIEQLRSEGIPAGILSELEHYAPDLLPDDWEMMVEVDGAP